MTYLSSSELLMIHALIGYFCVYFYEKSSVLCSPQAPCIIIIVLTVPCTQLSWLHVDPFSPSDCPIRNKACVYLISVPASESTAQLRLGVLRIFAK
jgi:hypothetical protein